MSITAAVAPVAVKSATGVLTAAGVWSGVIALLLIVVLAIVKIMPRLRELEINNNAGLRREFIDEMAALRSEVKASRAENEALREEVRTLRQEVGERDDKIDLMRKEIRSLHDTIDGMRRANLQAGNSAARAVAEALPEGTVPPATREALKRIAGE